MRPHTPILKTASAAIACYALVLLIHRGALSELPAIGPLIGSFLLGVLYTQLVEYWYHKVPMHRGLPFLDDLRRNHLEHHQAFHGPSFRTRDEKELEHIPGRWWVFPILFLGHYLLLTSLVPTGVVLAFLLGAVLHYLAFELSHWFTHVDDNALDRLLTRLPLLARWRAVQIEHHRWHHEFPDVGFNFNPPYLGDRLFHRMPDPARGVALAVPETALAQNPPEVTVPPSAASQSVSEPTLPSRRPWVTPLLRYGSAVAVGAALVGLAVLAHGRWSQDRPSPTSELKL